jgi:hypothetical protein
MGWITKQNDWLAKFNAMTDKDKLRAVEELETEINSLIARRLRVEPQEFVCQCGKLKETEVDALSCDCPSEVRSTPQLAVA